MIASAHVFRFRSFRDAGRSLFADRRRLADVQGLRFGRLVFVGGTRSEGFTIGVVEPRRQMALCLWESEHALERFRERSPIGRAWSAASDEYCEVRMKPFRTHGSYRGEEPLAGLRGRPSGQGPVALWTFANIPWRGRLHFWSSIRGATRTLMSSPGLIAGTAGPEQLYSGAMTFTIWRSLEDVLGFAYRGDPHRQIVKRVREEQLLTDSMFIRLEPYRAEGRWPSGSRFTASFDEFSKAL
jgi:hypothetical protein